MTEPPKTLAGKPGRPRVVILGHPDLSVRTNNQHHHAGIVIKLLGLLDDSGVKTVLIVPTRYRYFFPTGTWHHAKWDVLAELGRVRNVVAIKIFADRICKLKPPAKQAVALIREWRQTFEYWVVSDIQAGSYSWMFKEGPLTAVTDVPPKLKRKVITFITATARAVCDGSPLPEELQPFADFRLSLVRAKVRKLKEWIDALSDSPKAILDAS